MYDDEEEDESRFSRGPKVQLPPEEQFDQLEPGDSFEMVETPAPPAPSPNRSRPPARQPQPRPPVQQQPHTPAEDEDDGFFAKHKIKFVFAGIVAVFGATAFFMKPGTGAPAKAAPQVVSIKLPPLPPPPPPPPPKVQPPPPKEQPKMEQQQPVAQEEKHEEAPKPKAEAPAPNLGTGLKGDGAGMSGLGGSGNGGGFGGSGSGGGGSKWGWYAGKVQSSVAAALRRNKTTKAASLQVQVRIWPDPDTGRVSRAKLDGSTGDRNLDNAIVNEVLTGLQLEAPPKGMSVPIVMRLSAHRP